MGGANCGQPIHRATDFAMTDKTPEFKSATLDAVRKHDYVLTPGRYVGAEAQEDDDEAFADKMQRLTAQLGEQMARGTELDVVIRKKLGALGYGL